MRALAEVVAATQAPPIRVLHLRDSPWVDGPGRTILETASHVDPARVDYHIGAFVSPGQQQHAMVEGARARGVQVHVINDRPGLDKRLVGDILELIDRHRIDILHTSEFRSNVLSLLCRRRSNLITVSTAHGWIANDLRGRIFRVADKMVLRQFDAVILVSHAMRRLVPRWWLPQSRAHVLHNALVLESYGREILTAGRPQRDPNAPVRLLNVGRLSPEKGQHLLLQAFATVLKEHPRTELVFAGIGPLEDSLRTTAQQLGIQDNVVFRGYVSDMPALYAECDLVVQSSFTEGLPNVILEAAYLRMPIVATAVGGTAEVIEHGRSGWLIKPHSLAELTDGLRRFLDDPAHFRTMADRGHGDVREKFSFDARTEALTALYRQLMDRRR